MLLFASNTFATRDWKGKGKARDAAEPEARDDGAGGEEGIVIPLQLLQESAYESLYVAPVSLGSSHRQFLLQVDTGSSDLPQWIASTSCSTSSCNAAGSSKYDPSQATPVGVPPASVSYAEGKASGPIVWDSVQLGGYSIDHQALIAATTVDAEPLSSNFVGVLGLALPLNSVIAQTIPPTTSDAPDGASLSSNLFGITPLKTSPPSRFLSIALERPGSDKVSSTLGIGRHPADLVPDPSKVQYAATVPGSLWWQANVHAITVYVNGQAKTVSLPLSGTGTNGQPSAILDTGVPLIIASPAITYGIYGAMGYSPAADGNVYIPCNQPLNMSITLDDRSEVPIHPLDLTYYPPGDPSAENCIGAIQTPNQIGAAITQADMILGVPFLRNTYTVLGYDVPAKNGVFPDNTGASERVQPRLGLMQLTDPATAAAEFHQVRVLRQPITSGGNTSPSGVSPAPTKKGLSVGIEVLIGLLGFFGLCFVLFSARLVYMKRKYRRAPTALPGGLGGDSKDGSYALNDLGYQPASRKSHSREPSEDELRTKRYEEYKRKRDLESTYSDSTMTRVADGDDGEGGAADEFGALTGKTRRAESPEERFRDPWSIPDATLVDGSRPPLPSALLSPDELTRPLPTARRASYTPTSPLAHHRTPSGGPSAAVPLLAHGRSYSNPHPQDLDSGDIAEFGMPFDFDRDRPVSMAGVGTSWRSRRLGSGGSAAALMLPATPSSTMSPSERAARFPLPPSPLLSPTRTVMSPRAMDSIYATSPPSPPLSPMPTLPRAMSPRPLEPVYSTSRNESRVSEIGHEP
ncbi:aspartic peptidase domain-containing protein [Trametes gibbosa]|nr:aspartic peptidase domain-containing protein [Trametes gibbosa]